MRYDVRCPRGNHNLMFHDTSVFTNNLDESSRLSMQSRLSSVRHSHRVSTLPSYISVLERRPLVVCDSLEIEQFNCISLETFDC